MDTPTKQTELGEVLRLLTLGLTKKEVREKLNLKRSALAYHLGKLEKGGYIQREGKYLIKVLRSSVSTPGVTKNQVQYKLNKRGHAYNFRVVFVKERTLHNKAVLKDKSLELLPFGSYKLTIDNCSVWVNKQSLTIYSSNSYYSKDALHSKFRALREVDNLIKKLMDRYGFKGLYGIEVFREHYGLIFNRFAKWILDQGGKMYVKNRGKKSILWVDNSRKDDIGLSEFEANDPIRANKADNYFKSHEATGWAVTPQFVLNAIHGNAENHASYAKHLKAHVESVKELGAGVKKLTDTITKLEEFKK